MKHTGSALFQEDQPVKKFFKSVSPNVIWLGLVSFLNDLSSEMILPILPMFIESLGGGKIAVGLLGGIRDGLSSILNVLSGYWSAKTGKKKIFLQAGYLTSAVFKLLLGLCSTFRGAIFFASMERVGKGLRTAPRDAIISESMNQKKGTGFGIHRAFDTMGAIIGSLTAFSLLWFFGVGFKWIILIAAALSFAGVVPLLFVRESHQGSIHTTLSINLKQLPSNLKLFIFIASIFSLGNFSYMFFILRAKQFLSGNLSEAIAVLLYVFFNIFYVLFSMPLGVLSDRIGKGKVIAAGYLLFSVVSFGFIFSSSMRGLMILFALYGIANTALDGNQRAFVADSAGAQLRPIALGAYHTLTGLSALPASLTAGLLGKYISDKAIFIYGASVSLVCVFLLILFLSYRRRELK
jgi:MFS family permease